MDARAAARASLDAAVLALAGLAVSDLTLDEVHAETRWLQRIRSQLDALAVSLVARRRDLLHLTDDVGRGLASDARISGREAKRLASTAVALDALPSEAREALARGDVSAEHVRALSRGGGELDDETKLQLLERAKQTTVDSFRRRVHEAALRADPDGSTRQRRQRAARDASLVDGDDGMTDLRASFAADDGAVVRAALHRAVDDLWRVEHRGRERAPLDRPTFGARLADAIVHVCRRYLEPARTAARARAVPLLSLQVDLRTLRDGLHANARHHTDWGQPLPVETLRRLACEADIVPAVMGSGSVPLDLGRSRRYPTTGQRLAVIMRDRRCRFPGCESPPAFCDVHHVVHWVEFGPTDLHNLVLLCGRHHHAVHEGGWSLTGDANGRLRVEPPPESRRRPPAPSPGARRCAA